MVANTAMAMRRVRIVAMCFRRNEGGEGGTDDEDDREEPGSESPEIRSSLPSWCSGSMAAKARAGVKKERILIGSLSKSRNSAK
jgi:hypothetical protein